MAMTKTRALSKKDLELALLFVPGMLSVLVFSYFPMAGLILAFKNYTYDKGIWGSDWAGLNNFKFLFTSEDAWIITRNTLAYNFLFILLGTACSVSFAIMLNEIKSKKLVGFYQTTMFFPYFLSWIVISYLVFALLDNSYGLINSLRQVFGMEKISFYTQTAYWPYIIVFTNLWKYIGYSSVIYYAGILGLDSTCYESALIDGANRFQVIFKITLPLLSPLIIVLIIISIGQVMYSDYGLFYFVPKQVDLLYPVTETIDTYVLKALRKTGDLGMATAANFYQSIVGFIMVLSSNAIIARIRNESKIF